MTITILGTQALVIATVIGTVMAVLVTGPSNYVNNPSSSVVDVNSSVGYTSPSYEGASSRAKTPPPLPPKVSLNLSPTRISNSFLDTEFCISNLTIL